MKLKPNTHSLRAGLTIISALLVFSADTSAADVTSPLACNDAGICFERSAQASVRTQVPPTSRPALLVAATGTGIGDVVSVPSGISCYIPRPGVNYLVAPDCMETFAAPLQLTLTARADSDSVFAGWTGACSGQSPSCTVTVTAVAHSATAVGAQFVRTQVAADCLFDWAEAAFPIQLAPRATSSTQSGLRFYFRYYSATNSYLGVHEADQHVYFLASGTVMVDLGGVSDLMVMAGCR